MLETMIVALTILYSVLTSELIMFIKDINKRMKNTNISSDILKKMKMGKIACVACIVILIVVLLTNYLSFFKII